MLSDVNNLQCRHDLALNRCEETLLRAPHLPASGRGWLPGFEHRKVARVLQISSTCFQNKNFVFEKKLENVVILHLPSSIRTFISNVLFYTLFFIKKDLHHRGKKHSVKHIMTLLLKAHIRIFQGSTILTRIVFFISHNF